MKVETRGSRALPRSPRPDIRKQKNEQPDMKLPDPMVCPKCSAAYRKGRWTWGDAPPDAVRMKCPACRRVEENFPAGEVTLKGPFLKAHRTEVLNLVMSREARARKDYPMQRLIAVTDIPDGVRVTTTDGNLARTIALAVHEACKGDLDLTFVKDENFVRATWSR